MDGGTDPGAGTATGDLIPGPNEAASGDITPIVIAFGETGIARGSVVVGGSGWGACP